MRITLLESDCGTFLLRAEDDRTILVQMDWDFPGVAETFGWSPPAGTLTDDIGKFAEESLFAVIGDARDFLHERAGTSTSDPGYF
jgi:hypothetical protein